MSENLMEIRNLSFRYGQSVIFNQIQLSIQQKKITVVIGPNGSGKSTLLKILIGLIQPTQGTIHFAKKLSPSQMSYVTQEANHQARKGFPATVKEVVASGLYGKLGWFGRMKKKDWRFVDQVLEQVGLRELKERNIGKLSGGQRQRVFIARSLVSEPKLLILDEPTVGVDVGAKNDFYQLLKKLNRQLGITILLVTHDLEMVSRVADQVIGINKGIMFDGPVESFVEKEGHILTTLFHGAGKGGEPHV